MGDSEVSEIASNGGSTSLYLRREGRRIEAPNVFLDNRHYSESILELVQMIRPEATEVRPYLEEGTLYLPNGGIARVHITLPPACLYPNVTIARKTQSLTTLEDIAYSGSMSNKMLSFIRAAVETRLTICFSGGTGSGKTTMLEAATKLWPHNARIGVVEDAPELQLEQPNVVYLKSEVRRPGQDEGDVATLDWCVAQLNRQRVDLMIIGETRGKEFASFLTAANSGNEGSLTTIHADNPQLCLQKMTQFVSMARTTSQRSINQNIASTIDIIIQLNKTEDGRYRTTAIAEVSNMLSTDESATIATQPIFTYDRERDSWIEGRPTEKLIEHFVKNGYSPDTYMPIETQRPNEKMERISRPTSRQDKTDAERLPRRFRGR